MKNLLSSYFIVFILFLTLSSCTKDNDERVDKNINKKSSIVFTTPENDDRVWNNVTFSTEISNESEVEKVTFYIAGKLSDEIHSPPFDYTLNTKAYNDGPLEIRAVAHYKTGDKYEATIKVNVLNTLFTLSVPDMLGPSAAIFLSDHEGNSLGTQLLEKGATIEFIRPDYFEGVTFNFNILYKGPDYIHIRTYTDIEIMGMKGKLEDLYMDPIGRVSIEWDAFEPYTYMRFMGGGVLDLTQSDECFNCEIDLDITKDPTDILVIKGSLSKNPSYTFLQNIRVGDNVSLDENDFIPMSKREVRVAEVQGYTQTLITLFGNDDLKAKYNYRMGGVFSPSGINMELYWPEDDLFSSYRTMYAKYGNKKSLIYEVVGEDLQPFVAPSFDIENSEGTDLTIEATVNGEFDWYAAQWRDVINGVEHIHFVIGKASNHIMATRPQLPEDILEVFPTFKEVTFKPSDIRVVNNYAIQSYNEYIEHHLGISRNEEFSREEHSVAWEFEN